MNESHFTSFAYPPCLVDSTRVLIRFLYANDIMVIVGNDK